jgi:hypothetical protein
MRVPNVPPITWPGNGLPGLAGGHREAAGQIPPPGPELPGRLVIMAPQAVILLYAVLFGARRGATIGRPPGSTPLGRLALSVVLRGMRP